MHFTKVNRTPANALTSKWWPSSAITIALSGERHGMWRAQCWPRPGTMDMCECGKVSYKHLGLFIFVTNNFPHPVNYQKNWKCAAVLKPDGTSTSSSGAGHDTPPRNHSFQLSATTPGSNNNGNAPLSSSQQQQAAAAAAANNTTKYYKRGIISHPNQVPWH